jgi:hypothetical protein
VTPVQQYRLWVGIGGVIVALCVAYWLLAIVDRVGLANERAAAVVLSKEHRGPGRTYLTQIVNNRPVVLPQETGEIFALALDVDGTKAEGSVDKGLFDAVEVNQKVDVVYQRRRLTGGLQIVSVRR